MFKIWVVESPDGYAFAVLLIKPLPNLFSFVEHNAAGILTKINGISILIQSQDIDTVIHGLLTQASNFDVPHFLVQLADWTIGYTTFLLKERDSKGFKPFFRSTSSMTVTSSVSK